MMNHLDIVLSYHLQKQIRWMGPKMTELRRFLCGYVNFLENMLFAQMSKLLARIGLIGPSCFVSCILSWLSGRMPICLTMVSKSGGWSSSVNLGTGMVFQVDGYNLALSSRLWFQPQSTWHVFIGNNIAKLSQFSTLVLAEAEFSFSSSLIQPLTQPPDRESIRNAIHSRRNKTNVVRLY